MKSIVIIYITVFALAIMFTFNGVTYAEDVNIKLGSTGDAFRVKDPDSASLMTVLGTGNVGIGTTSLGAKLHVYGNIPEFSLESSGAGNSGMANFWNSSGKKGEIQYLSTTDQFTFTTIAGNGYNFAGGNVGIGTTSPIKLLHIKSTTGSNGLRIENDKNDALVYMINTDTNSGWIFGNDGNGNNGGPDDFVFNEFNPSGDTNRIVVAKGGNVGIGTAGPGEKLAVSGRISLTTDPDSADDVGDRGYNDARYLLESNNLSDLADTATARTNLGVRGFNSGYSSDNAVYIRNNGWVGMGTTTPSTTLHVRGSSTFADVLLTTSTGSSGGRMRLTDAELQVGLIETGSLRFITNNAYKMTIDSIGDVTGIHGTYHVSSDIRNKKDVVNITEALEKVLSLRGVNFRWNDGSDNGTIQMGMIAQEVEKVVPEVVHTADDEKLTKAIEYPFLTGLLVEAIKELKEEKDAEIIALKTENDAMKQELDEVKTENVKLKENLLVLVRRQDTLESIVFARTSIENGKLAKLDDTD